MGAARQWVAFPGLACPPSDFDDIANRARARGMDVHVVDPWRSPFATTGDRICAELGLDPALGIGVVAHSLGALPALELATRYDLRGLVLLDPTDPAEGRREPAWARSALVDRVVRASIHAATGSPTAVIAGTRLHRVLVARAGGPSIDPVDSMARFGRRDGLERLWEELRDSWALAATIDDLCATPRGVRRLATTPITQVVGTRRASVGFLREQRALAERLGARLVGLPRSGHLIPRSSPEVVVRAMADVESRASVGCEPSEGPVISANHTRSVKSPVKHNPCGCGISCAVIQY